MRAGHSGDRGVCLCKDRERNRDRDFGSKTEYRVEAYTEVKKSKRETMQVRDDKQEKREEAGL